MKIDIMKGKLEMTTITVYSLKQSIIQIEATTGKQNEINFSGMHNESSEYYDPSISLDNGDQIFLKYDGEKITENDEIYKYNFLKGTYSKLSFPETNICLDGRFVYFYQTINPRLLMAVRRSKDTNILFKEYLINEYPGEKEILFTFDENRNQGHYYECRDLSPYKDYYSFLEYFHNSRIFEMFNIQQRKKVKIFSETERNGSHLHYIGLTKGK